MVTAEGAYPLRLIKQVAAMFLTINSLDFRHSQVGQAVADFVLDREATGVPKELRFFGYLNHEGQFRYLPLMLKFNIFEATICQMSEITHPPLGWVMTLNSESPDERLSELTNCGDVPYNVNATVQALMHRLSTYMAMFPGDYRTLDELTEEERQQIEAEQADLRNAENELKDKVGNTVSEDGEAEGDSS
jgi:hypothetical protein